MKGVNGVCWVLRLMPRVQFEQGYMGLGAGFLLLIRSELTPAPPSRHHVPFPSGQE